MLGLRSLRSLRPRRMNQYWVGLVKISAAFGGLDTGLVSGGAATRRAALWTYVHVGPRSQKIPRERPGENNTTSVEVDYYWGGELSVFGSSVNTSNWDTKLAIYPPWHTYNTSASSSYNRLPGDFSDDYAVIDDYGDPHFYHLRGHTGSDVIHLDGLNLTNVPMGIIDSAPLHNDVFYFPTDATLGLADEDPDIDTHLNDSFVKLISPQLDKPVVCLWSNR
ncbi:hypothetical protein DdX_20346 [Ditylenchus destructor]|uniref:Uncharacterized protein n=1 Tax=Ditylenchus destructor TaxID=166010 RepID=A0AAD4QRW6_9BILA|nr:hypothetical protein DdX_20346 [Ditylenchus destructor]